jgi:Vitamin K-dependent gamma-carboxylase
MFRDLREGSAQGIEALSAFRIAFSLYLLLDYELNLAGYLPDFFGDDGILPLAALATDRFWAAGTPIMVPLVMLLERFHLPTLMFAIYPAVLVAFCIGYRTRVTNVAIFLINVYIYWRNPILRSGAETLANLLLLWCLFLPLNRYWSVDAALDPSPRNRPHPELPFWVLRLQIASLYLFSGLLKVMGAPWREGTAIAAALSDNIFGATPLARVLLTDASVLLPVANYLVIGFQLVFALLIYCPWHNNITRATALLGAAFLHVAFIFCLNVGGFPYLCLIMLLLLVPDTWINHVLHSRRDRLSRVSLFYEDGCKFCCKMALLLREFFLSPSSMVLPASSDLRAASLLREHQSWVVRTSDGADLMRWRAIAYVLRARALTAPIGWLTDRPGFSRIFEQFYLFIGRNRPNLGMVTALLLPYRKNLPDGQPTLAVCGILAALALAGNVDTLLRPNNAPDVFRHVLSVLQVAQRWTLFAPEPTKYRWQFQATVHDANLPPQPLSQVLAKPLFASLDDSKTVVFANHRWLKYFSRFEFFNEAEWDALGRYLCHCILEQNHIVGAPPLWIEFVAVRFATDEQSASENRYFFCSGIKRGYGSEIGNRQNF